MDNINFASRRSRPLHAPSPLVDELQNTLENNALQQDEAPPLHTAAVPETSQYTTTPSANEYTISVEQVREHLRKKGLSKSKDTIQRWCRTGDLDCKKQGILNRFFTTEASLQALEARLLPDMIADQVGGKQVNEPAFPQENSDPQVHEAEDEAASTEMQLDEGAEKTAFSGTQLHEANRATASNSTQVASAEVAELRAQVAGLTSQLEQAQQISKFLQEEIVSARGQRGDVVKIAEQMLGTLETIAVGGRLEKITRQDAPVSVDPVSYRQVTPDTGAV